MTSTSEHDDTLRLRIKDLLSFGIGISVEIAGRLYIRDLDNGDYAVGGQRPKEENNYEEWVDWEDTFSDLDEAIEFFINKRNNGKLGDDFWVVDEN